MKRNLKSLSVLLPVVALLLTMIGCTNKELAVARQANDLANRKLTETEEKLKTMQGECDLLRRGSAAREAAEAALKKQNDLYVAECARLKNDADEFKTLYEKELARSKGLTVGTGPLPPEMDRALRAFAQANPNLMEYQSKFGMVKLKSDMSFASGSADVQAEAGAALKKLVAILTSPQGGAFHVYVAGHTDDVPIGNPVTRKMHPTNWYLSVHRAIGVQKVLVRSGMPPERIGVMGFGEYYPVVPNKPNKKGHSLNRRVELWILPTSRLLTRPMQPGT